MNTQRTLSVLLIDDTEEVLTNLQAHLEQEVKVDPLCTRIQITTVHIQLESNPTCTCYQVKSETILELAWKCSHKFDYIFSDFAFIGDTQKNEALRETLLKDKRIIRSADLTQGTVLQVADIKKMLETMRSQNLIDCDLITNVKHNFLGHSGPVVVYTNSAEPFASYFNGDALKVRRNEIRSVFSNASSVEFILMHDEFSITPQIMALFNRPEERKSYYSKLLSRKIESELHAIVLRKMVHAQHNLRFKRTWRAFQFLTLVGVGFGGAVAAYGEMLFHFLHDSMIMVSRWRHWGEFDNSAYAHIVAFFSLLALSILVPPVLAVFIARAAERKLDDLLEP